MQKLRNYNLDSKLIDQAINPITQAEEMAKGPRVTDYSKKKIADIIGRQEIGAPFRPDQQKDLTGKAQDLINRLNVETDPEDPDPKKLPFRDQLVYFSNPRELSKKDKVRYDELHEQMKSPAFRHFEKQLGKVGAPITSTLDAADAVFNAPVRPLAETTDAARKYLTWYLQGMEGPAPEYHPGDAFLRRDNAAKGFGDVFRNSYQQGVGGRDLNLLENAVMSIAGMVPDVLAGNAALKPLLPFKRVPATQAVEENLRSTLKQSGVDAASAKTPWWKPQLSEASAPRPTPPTEGQIVPEVVSHVADQAATPTAHPDRLKVLRDLTQKIGQMYGMTPEQITQLDANLIRQVGEEGRFATQTGNLPSAVRKIFPLKQEAVERIQNPGEGQLKFGAGQLQGRIPRASRAVKGWFSAARGAPEGVQDVIREPQGAAAAAALPVSQNARAIGDSFADPVRAEQVTRYVDAEYTRRNAATAMDKAAENLKNLEGELAKVEQEVGTALKGTEPFEAAKALQRAQEVVAAHPGVSLEGNAKLGSPIASAQRDLWRLKQLQKEAADAQAPVIKARQAAVQKLPRVTAAAKKILVQEETMLAQATDASGKSIRAMDAGMRQALSDFRAAEVAGDTAAQGVAKARLGEAVVRYGKGFDWGRRGYHGTPLRIPVGATADELTRDALSLLDGEWQRLGEHVKNGKGQLAQLQAEVQASVQGLEKIQNLDPAFARDRIVAINKSLRNYTKGLAWKSAKDIKGELPVAAREVKQALSEWSRGKRGAAKVVDREARVRGGVLAKVREPVVTERVRYQDRLVRQDRINARHEEMAKKGWAPKSPKEQQAFDFMAEEFERIHGIDEAVLGKHGDQANYLAREETAKSKDWNAKFRAPDSNRHATSAKGFLKPREPWEKGITIEGTSLHKFEQHPAQIYAKRVAQSHMAWASAKSEQMTLQAYGTKLEQRPIRDLDGTTRRGITSEREASLMRAADARGEDVVFWEQRLGPNAGDVYVLDKRAADLLNKVMSPDVHGEVYKAYQDVMGWWKTMATVSRPSFVERNFLLGNLMNMFLGDVAIHDLGLWSDAAKVLALKEFDHFGAISAAEKLQKAVFARGAKPDTVVQGKTIREWQEIIDRNTVVSKGQVGYEPGMEAREAGKAPPTWKSRVNPLSTEFAWYKTIGTTNTYLENLSKTVVMMDRVRKGYKEWEGARAVADFLFNYGETSKVLGSDAMSLASAFPKFKYKNYGLQFNSLFTRPDKFSKFLSVQNGLQDIDPTDDKEVSRGMAVTREATERQRKKEQGLPLSVRSNEFFRFPILRGKEGSRRFFPTKSATPMGQLGELSLDLLLQGEEGDWADAMVRTLNDWLGPVGSTGLKWVISANTGRWPTFGDQTIRSDDTSYVPAPAAMNALLEYAKNGPAPAKKLYHLLTNDSKWFRAETGLADGTLQDVPGKYQWVRGARDIFETADPVLGVVRRVFGDESMDYSGLWATFGPGKLTDFTDSLLKKWKIQQGQKEVQDKLDAEKRRQIDAGEQVDIP
jgi:hypothetical protein